MTSHFETSQKPRPTRRQFLTTTAAGLAALPFADRAIGQITGPAVPKLTAFDELMTAFMREHRPPGAALAVAYHGRLVYARGFGLADVEKREPVRPISLQQVCQAWLEERNLTSSELGELVLVNVDASDVRA